jgi:hypothetical protein
MLAGKGCCEKKETVEETVEQPDWEGWIYNSITEHANSLRVMERWQHGLLISNLLLWYCLIRK